MALATTEVSGGRILLYSGIMSTADSTMILAGAGLRAGVRQAGFTGEDFTEEALVMAGEAVTEAAAVDMEDDSQTTETL